MKSVSKRQNAYDEKRSLEEFRKTAQHPDMNQGALAEIAQQLASLQLILGDLQQENTEIRLENLNI